MSRMTVKEILEYTWLELDRDIVWYDHSLLTYLTYPHENSGRRLFVNRIEEEREDEGVATYLASVFDVDVFDKLNNQEIDIKSAVLDETTINFLMGTQTFSRKVGDVTTITYPYFVYTSSSSIKAKDLPLEGVLLPKEIIEE